MLFIKYFNNTKMRIHLPLDPSHFANPIAGPSKGPLAQIGRDLVVIELQGELEWEGDKSNGVVGVLGLDRPDKPTLHLGEHHLLHGKISTLAKPYAVIRRVIGNPSGEGLGSATAMEGDADEEEDEEAAEEEEQAVATPHKATNGTGAANGKKREANEDEEDEPPLFPPSSPPLPFTPDAKHVASSSSPWIPSSSIKDYSSDLDFSSPPGSEDRKRDRSDDDSEDEDESPEERRKRLKIEAKRAERRANRPERTRYYEVVGVVRKKVVFALRPEPIVTATILPD